MSSQANSAPPDQAQRDRALDPGRSVLVQAPAGSGKTTLLAERFLRLLAEVDEPGQVVAITFTNAAAAEMRNRILDELRMDEPSPLARRVFEHSQALGWKLLDLPAQLRISTIDSFCRDLALQQPLLSGLGGGLGIAEQPVDLYRRAARQTLEQIDSVNSALSQAIEALLLWRDNNWQEMEDLLIEMLGQRDRWMHGFVLNREPDPLDPQPDALRNRLERPFANAVRVSLTRLSLLLDQAPGACGDALELARFACSQTGGKLHRQLAELADFPSGPFPSSAALEEAREAYLALAALLLNNEGGFRRQVNIRIGFPTEHKREKNQLLGLVLKLKAIPGLESALAEVRSLPPARYTEDDWMIVCSCFTLLRDAAARLKVVFAEAGAVDFIEVAQIAQRVLKDDDGLPTDTAMVLADGIRHLLVDEFQDTSRRQHQLLAGLVAAWPELTGRTCFAVGDPMQSIYFFRDADSELFERVKAIGLEIPNAEPLLFDQVSLAANFRTSPQLVRRLNEVFERLFADVDGSGVTFSSAMPAREDHPGPNPRFKLHLNFVSQTTHKKSIDSEDLHEKEAARDAQTGEIVELIRSHLEPMREARARAGSNQKYRIAVLGRTRNALAPIASALREAAIPFRAVDLEKLSTRPEVLDALSLARALFNAHDRVAWLGVLRAPWCGLDLGDLHRLVSADNEELLSRPVPDLLAERLTLLSEEGQNAASRVLDTLTSMPTHRAAQPAASPGTWLNQVWLRLGGDACVDATGLANLDLLWNCLDRLPAGEPDILGPVLDAALDKLTALPDPDAETDFGVQLMTIHKSKGLEFEVVIVPELQAAGGRGARKMLSWLERGLKPETDPDIESGLVYSDEFPRNDPEEITEFLIAPLQPKGAYRGKAKEWVDRVYREREQQETRRILYVAATRAREELHLFARPAYMLESDGSLSLPNPTNSLLATAWPALEDEVRNRFEKWKTGVGVMGTEIETIAAQGENNLLVMPSPAKPTMLRRLPPDFRHAPGEASSQSATELPIQAEILGDISLAGTETMSRLESQGAYRSSGTGKSTLYSRHEGGQLSRVLGRAVHLLLQELTRLRTTHKWEPARTALQNLEPRIAAQARAAGVDASKADGIAAEALRLALAASRSLLGDWILSPHAEAASEVSWAGMIAGSLRTVRVDRVFRAGLTPLSDEENCWWIVDYKTAHADALAPDAALRELRPLFAPQLDAYAEVLRNLHGEDANIRAALYYPRMLLLDWWEL